MRRKYFANPVRRATDEQRQTKAIGVKSGLALRTCDWVTRRITLGLEGGVVGFKDGANSPDCTTCSRALKSVGAGLVLPLCRGGGRRRVS